MRASRDEAKARKKRFTKLLGEISLEGAMESAGESSIFDFCLFLRDWDQCGHGIHRPGIASF
jgi:hypothetical protein